MAEQVTESPRWDDEERTRLSDVPFEQHVRNLVAIDNANMPIEDANKPRGNQLLKKALDESIRVAEVCTRRAKKLEDRSDRATTSLLQTIGFYVIFQGAMLTMTVAAAQMVLLLKWWYRWIPVSLSLNAGVWLGVSILRFGLTIKNLKQKRFEEEQRRLVFERNELELQRHGHSFNFEAHGHNYTPFRIPNRTGVTSYLGLVVIIVYTFTYLIVLFESQILRIGGSTSAGGAPSPAPSIDSVQSGAPGKTWCVAKAGSPDTDVMNGLNFACGEGGADCGPIQAGGVCFNPNTIVSHASFAYNTYYQKVGRNIWNCDFGGTGVIANTDPSYSGCRFL